MSTEPAKPKLVAKTGQENSPWKVQRNAPTVPATDVPNPLRPMMSCTLWRNQESIHRNDENQVFVLTDQSGTRDVAKKLNINVRSTNQLAAYLAKLRTPTNLESFGQPEQDFGIRPVKERQPIKNTAVKAFRLHTTNGDTDVSGLSRNEDKLGEATSSSGIDLMADVSTPQPNAAEEVKDHTSTLSEQSAANSAQSKACHLANTSNEDIKVGLESKIGEEIPPKLENEESTTISESQSQEGLSENQSSEIVMHPDKNVTNKSISEKPSKEEINEKTSSRTSTQAPAYNAWSRTWADALTGNFSKKVPPPHIESYEPATDKSAAPIEPLLPPRKAITPPVAKPAKTPEEIEDSDEEVVVFQPKRLSAQQKKPTQQNSRPSTPNVQAQHAPSARSPHASTAKGQNAPKANHRQAKHIKDNGPTTPKLSNPTPPVIDPDAFGRDFAINTNPPARGSMRGPKVRHSPQASFHHPGLPRSRPTSLHRQPQASPNQATPKTSPQQVPKTPVLLNGITGGAETKQLPIGTGRPSPKPTPETRVPSLNANAPVFQPANTSSPLPPSLVQQRPVQTPPAAAAKLAPIGSGRPSSKKAQQSSATKQHILNNEPVQQKPAIFLAPTQPTPDDQQQDPASAGPSLTQQPFVRPQHHPQPPANQAFTPTPPFGPQSNVATRRAANGFAPRGRGGGVAPPRPVKPSLFDPELDHTKAYQPDIEPRKSAAPQEVQYVLKSGSTREQVRGKGKLWVG